MVALIQRLGAPNWKALVLASLGLLLVFASPPHRVDLLIIGLVLALGGSVWSPLAGVALIGATLPVFFFGRQIAGPISFSPPGLVLLLTWVAVLTWHRQLQLKWPRAVYDPPLALFLAAALLSLTVTQYPLLSVRELRAVILEPVIFFWLLQSMPGSARWALYGFLASATITALAAIAQGPLGLGGTQAEGVLRVQAWYPSANHLALMLGRAWPFLLAGALASRRWLWVPAGLVGVGLLLTFSTGGWLGALAATLAVVVCLGRARRALSIAGLSAAALAIVGALAAGGRLPERLNPLRQTGGFRLDLWQSALEMLRDHPLLGVGLDNFAYLYQQYYLRPGAAAEPNLSHPHNWVLDFWLSLGLPGVLAFVWLVLGFARQVWRGSRRWVVLGAAGAMADMLVHGFIDNSYFLVDLAYVFWLSLALASPESSDD